MQGAFAPAVALAGVSSEYVNEEHRCFFHAIGTHSCQRRVACASVKCKQVRKARGCSGAVSGRWGEDAVVQCGVGGNWPAASVTLTFSRCASTVQMMLGLNTGSKAAR
jgi:hypothetical protein